MNCYSFNICVIGLVILLFGTKMSLYGQLNPKDSTIQVPMFSLSYAYQFPEGNLKDRFFPNSNIGAEFMLKTKKNWLFGIDGRFLFKDKVKETSILDNLKTSSNFVIDKYGEPGDILLYERGFMFSGKFGKMFSLFQLNPNSGFIALIGMGYMQHKIRIENEDNTVPQISGSYKKGYDRFTNGIALTEFVGYQFLGNTRLLNFFIGVEFIQGYTKNRRSINFDMMRKDDTNRKDYLYGFRFGWTLPLYKKVPNEFYYF